MIRTITLLLIFSLSAFQPVLAVDDEEDLSWPREITILDGTVTMYQPQLESFDNNELKGRMAISIEPPEKEIIFGAVRFSARMATDLETRVVVLEGIDIVESTFPDVEQEKVDKWAEAFTDKIEQAAPEMSLDRILAGLEVLEQKKDFAEQLNHQAPELYYRDHPAVLIYIDGEPILQQTDDESVEYVVNTPYFLVKFNEQYYLKGGDFWYASKEATTGWESTESVPSRLEELAEQVIERDTLESDSVLALPQDPPELIVTTVPAELIVVDGVPNYKPIAGTSLLYIDNTESDVVMDINSQEHYVLLAGRWYRAKSLQEGEWEFEEPENLPEDFSKIPKESDMANVRTSVPGTEEANAALLEQTIPQTATVDRNATVEVQFDGNPQFKKIEGTDVSYAENSDKTVLFIKNKYYCVDDAIWFESDQPTGPWVVSTTRPEEVDQIPPEEPVYNTKYVYIYDSTPEVVYVGYLPGYTCSYVYHGTVVYGTGWWYRPWWGAWYYPRPVTYGFSVHYNPWTGWGFSFGMSWGWFSVGWGARPWWGPAGYRWGYRHGFRRGYHHGFRRGYHAGRRAGFRAGYRAGQRSGSANVYRNRASGVRSTGRVNYANRAQNVNRANAANRASNVNRPQTRPSNRSNNVYAGQNGNVYRRDNNGNIQQRSNGQWQNYNNRSSSGSGNINNNRSNYQQQVNRDYQSRQRGNQRYNNYNRSSYSRPSSRPSGGGGRRRR